MLRPYGVLEMVRTGIVAMRRGKNTISPATAINGELDITEDDVSQFGLMMLPVFLCVLCGEEISAHRGRRSCHLANTIQVLDVHRDRNVGRISVIQKV